MSRQMASLKVDRLATKDQETPLRVKCLARGHTVFSGEITLNDFFGSLKHTTVENHAVVFFYLAGSQGMDWDEGCPMLFCNGKRVGSRRELPQDQGVPHPEAGEKANFAPEAGRVEVSLGQEDGPASKAGQVKASLVLDVLDVRVSAPSPEKRQKEAESKATHTAHKQASLVRRRVRRGGTDPSPLAQQEPRGSEKTGQQGRIRVAGRLSLGLVYSLLSIGQTLLLTILVYSVLQEYFSD